MLQTLVGVIVGGTLTIVSQVMVDVLRTTAERRKERSAARAILRVQQLHLNTAQHLLKESLETGRWWPSELAAFSLPIDQDLYTLTTLLPIGAWRSYTGAVRRLTGCANLRASAGDAEMIDTTTLQDFLAHDRALRI
jgi:type II secretory pathway pseudopilin PulG